MVFALNEKASLAEGISLNETETVLCVQEDHFEFRFAADGSFMKWREHADRVTPTE